MFQDSRLHLTCWMCALAGLLLAACQAAPTAPPTAIAATSAPPATSTSAPSTATPLPTDTPTAALTATPSSTTTPTDVPSATPSPTGASSPTAAPTPVPPATATVRPSALPTRPPVTLTPLGPPATNSVYSTTGGPAGYASTIHCQRAGAACTPVMPPGDLSFSLTLAGDASAPWTHFVYYGLSVEKNGANASDLFMFADAGWLRPGALVGFGASRGFSLPGAYVIRSSGCLTTDTKANGCGWATIAGDVVSFTIQ